MLRDNHHEFDNIKDRQSNESNFNGDAAIATGLSVMY